MVEALNGRRQGAALIRPLVAWGDPVWPGAPGNRTGSGGDRIHRAGALPAQATWYHGPLQLLHAFARACLPRGGAIRRRERGDRGRVYPLPDPPHAMHGTGVASNSRAAAA